MLAFWRKSQSFVITVLVSISGHGIWNGNLENSSIVVNIYLLFVSDGNGPLKSMFNCSNGCVAFMVWAGSGLWKRGLHSLEMEHEDLILRMSSTVNFHFSQMQSFVKFLQDAKIYEVHITMMY